MACHPLIFANVVAPYVPIKLISHQSILVNSAHSEMPGLGSHISVTSTTSTTPSPNFGSPVLDAHNCSSLSPRPPSRPSIIRITHPFSKFSFTTLSYLSLFELVFTTASEPSNKLPLFPDRRSYFNDDTRVVNTARVYPDFYYYPICDKYSLIFRSFTVP
jgi:hypothetical protein